MSHSPLERLQRDEIHLLSDADLLALIIRSGTAQHSPDDLARQILAACDGRLHHVDAGILSGIPLRPAQAASILSAIELARRMMQNAPQTRHPVLGAHDAAAIFQPYLAGLQQETLMVLLLDAHRRMISVVQVYVGSLAGTIIRSAEVYRPAILQGAAGLIMAHNHPSGDPTPSSEDVQVTQHLIDAGRTLDIPLYDHLVIGDGEWVSLREAGLAFGQ